MKTNPSVRRVRYRARTVRTTPEAKWETRVIRLANDLRTYYGALHSLPRSTLQVDREKAESRMEKAHERLMREIVGPIGESEEG